MSAAAAVDPTGVEPEPAASSIMGQGLARARIYVEWLVGAGVERGLLGPREPSRIWSRHVLNSAAVVDLLPPSATVVDIGSGAGLPGIPLAIAREDVLVILVEPLERRSVFLVEVIAALELTNCRVVRGRAEDVVDDCGGADVVTSRAVAPLAKLAGWSVPLARQGGELLALKGSSAVAELERDRAALVRLGLRDLRVEQIGTPPLDDPTTVVRGLVGPLPTKRSRR